jgi:SAM-dependent MidA family methyltransferase
LRAYYRHHPSHDLLARPGEQDLTTHVNFTALQVAGEAAGLKTDGLVTQTQFLTRIMERFAGAGAENWNSSRSRQFQTLTHPEHLGRTFRVLTQSR